ncbi:hypothetical protein ACH5RR_003214 [Cinchona calisaya]|uniref:Uncharacterized protein n=1 Tax=Cinchona calisaya TaxID=153742 RepID=A0ABD3AUJ1_9GENT
MAGGEGTGLDNSGKVRAETEEHDGELADVGGFWRYKEQERPASVLNSLQAFCIGDHPYAHVTVTLTSKECQLAHIRNVFDKRMCPHGQVTPKMDITCLRRTLKFINCLRKFKELTSVHIKFSYEMGTSSSMLLEWMAKFGPELESVVALLPTSVQKKT